MKWVLRAIAALIGLPLVVAGAFTGWNAFSLRADPDFVSYLKPNASPVDLSAARPFAIAPRPRVILLGEVHGLAAGQEFDFALLRQLNEERGLRFYIAEIDMAQAAAFNAYLDTGDEGPLKRVFRHWLEENAQWANAEFLGKVKKIRTLNQALPEERRIRFIGLDRVQDGPLMADYVGALAAEIPDAAWQGKAAFLAVLADEAARASTDPKGPIPVAAQEALKSLPDAAPEGVAPAHFAALKEASLRLAERLTLEFREPLIAAAAARLLADPAYADEPFFGLWGMFHVFDAPVSGGEPWAHLLQKQGAGFTGEIASIAIIYIDGRVMLPGGPVGAKTPYVEIPFSYDHPFIANVKGVNDFKAAAQGSATLFNLTADATPYAKSDRVGTLGGVVSLLQSFKIDGKKAGARGAIQYVLLVKGSAANTPLMTADIGE